MATTAPTIDQSAKGVTSTAVLDFLKKPKQLLIGGRWVSAKSGKTFENNKPGKRKSTRSRGGGREGRRG